MSAQTARIYGERDGDAVLVAAETDLHRLLIAGQAAADSSAEYNRIWDEISRLRTRINNTEPVTVIGCAVKLRYLVNPKHGASIGNRDDDVVSIRQILPVIEWAAELRQHVDETCRRLGLIPAASQPEGAREDARCE